jgi:hypothetical protein
MRSSAAGLTAEASGDEKEHRNKGERRGGMDVQLDVLFESEVSFEPEKGRVVSGYARRGAFKVRRQLTNSAHKNVVLSLVERGGEVRSYHVARAAP